MTMVRGDHEWARKWLAHYEQQVLDRTNLYVIIHGDDDLLREIFAGCSVLHAPLDDPGVQQFERRRLDFEHFFVRGLQAYFQCVLLVDIDEFVTVAPPKTVPLWSYLREAHEGEMVRSALGFEVIQIDEDTDALDMTAPILSQRKTVFCNAQYSKPCAFYFNFGGATHHRVWGAPWVIDPDLLLFHMRYCDRNRLETYAASRKAYHAEQADAGGATSGSWRHPWKTYRALMKEVSSRPTGVVTEEMRHALRRELLTRFAETNKIGGVTSGVLTLPPDYAALL